MVRTTLKTTLTTIQNKQPGPTRRNGKTASRWSPNTPQKDAYRSLKNPITLLQKRAATPMEISPSTNSATIAIRTTVDHSI